jgi:RNA polymerase sigma-70 factor, ECF subfamily
VGVIKLKEKNSECTIDDDYFIELVLSVKGMAYKLAYCYLHNSNDSMDAVSNALEMAYIHKHKLRNHEYFKTWFMKIVINECKKILRKHQKIRFISEKLIINNDLSRHSKFDNYENTDLICAIKKIDPFDRLLILMKYYMGYTLDEISQIVNLPVGTVKTKIYSSLKKIKKNIVIEEV